MDATGYNEHTNGQHRITGTFENTTHPTLTNGDDYRLLFTQARKGATGAEGDAADVPDGVTQAEAEAGTSTVDKLWSPQRVSQAISALESDDATGGGAAGSLVAFRANLASIAQTFSNVGWSDLLSIVGVVDINEGSFTTAAPSADRSSVNVPSDGAYKVGLNLRFEDDSTARLDVKIRIAVYRDTAALANPVAIGTAYYRGTAGSFGAGVNMVAFGNLEAGDQIRVQGRIESTAAVSEAFTIAPEASSIWVTKELGAAATGASGQASEAAMPTTATRSFGSTVKSKPMVEYRLTLDPPTRAASTSR